MHQVGSGVLGPVYRARRSDCGPADRGRLFALKAFHVDLTPEQTVVFGEALQEIVDARVSHAAVVSPVGAGVADGVPYLACEYVEAESLDVRMRPRTALAAGTALPFVVQLAAALDAAHGQGFAHGALHLRDVLVTAELARLGGFGIVAALDRVGHRGPLRPPYAAPERMAGGDWGAAADRYALAAVAWELLTGRRAAPAGGRTAANLERVLDADAAPRLLPIFEAAFSADPDRRPPSAGHFADALAGALGWTGAAGVREALVGGGEAGKSGDGRAPARGGGGPAVAAGVAALPVAAVGGTVMSRRRKRKDVDWSKQSLDFGRPDEPPRADGPRAGDAPPVDGGDAPSAPAGSGGEPFAAGGGGAAAGGDPGEAAAPDVYGHDPGPGHGAAGEAAAAPDVYGHDRRPEPGRGHGAAGEAAAAPDADGYAPIAVGDLESRVAGGGTRPDEVDPGPDYDPGDVVDEVDPGPDYDDPGEVVDEPQYGRAPAAPTRYDPGDVVDEVDPGADYDPGDVVDEPRPGRMPAVSARYDPGDVADEVDPGADYDPGDVVDEPQYGRMPAAPARYDPGDVVDDALGGVEPEHGASAPEVSVAEETGGGAVDDGFALAPEDAYDYGIEEESGPEEPAGEIFDRGPADQARRLPIALVAVLGVAVAVTAFVIGLGWMGGEAGDTETPSGPGEGREFSEGVVGAGAPASVPEPVADEGGTAAPARDIPPPAPDPSAAAPDTSPAAPNPPPAVRPPAAPAGDPPPAARDIRPAVRDTPPAAPAPRPSPPAVSEPEPPRPAPPPEAEPPPAGRLLVRSMPPGAEVVVNGEPRGTTPLALAALPYGPYDVEVTLAGYGSRRVRLVLDEDDPIGRFNADLTAAPAEPPAARSAPAGAAGGIGSFFAAARPAGAAHRPARRRAGGPPPPIPDMRAGERRIASGRRGRPTRAAAVRVAPATPARVAASLDAAAR